MLEQQILIHFIKIQILYKNSIRQLLIEFFFYIIGVNEIKFTY